MNNYELIKEAVKKNKSKKVPELKVRLHRKGFEFMYSAPRKKKK